MSEHRLSGRPSAYYLALFDAAGIMTNLAVQNHAAEAIVTIADEAHPFEVAFVTDGQSVCQDHIEAARSLLSQIVELDATATADIDGLAEDGELFVLDILSATEADFRYSSVSWNSEWREVFRRDERGKWVHQGIRRFHPPGSETTIR